MPDPLDLTGPIAEALASAAERHRPPVIAYVDDDGYPSISYRGSVYVHGPQEIALWARSVDTGLAAAIATRPQVALIYSDYSGPGVASVRVRGRARVEPSANEEVYATMPQGERDRDPEARGVAVIVEVETATGRGPDGPFSLARG